MSDVGRENKIVGCEDGYCTQQGDPERSRRMARDDGCQRECSEKYKTINH